MQVPSLYRDMHISSERDLNQQINIMMIIDSLHAYLGGCVGTQLEAHAHRERRQPGIHASRKHVNQPFGGEQVICRAKRANAWQDHKL